jgi:hypothetical protein
MAHEVKINEANGSTYKSVEIKVKGNIFCFMAVTGKFNYINVSKVTNNPFRTAGKVFENWEFAEANYGSPEMQMAIFSAQSILN